MSRQEIKRSIWTCDECDAEATTDSLESPMANWLHLSVIMYSERGARIADQFDLCSTCAEAFGGKLSRRARKQFSKLKMSG